MLRKCIENEKLSSEKRLITGRSIRIDARFRTANLLKQYMEIELSIVLSSRLVSKELLIAALQGAIWFKLPTSVLKSFSDNSG